MNEMHDAAEVLGQILDCLHRAELAAAPQPPPPTPLSPPPAARQPAGPSTPPSSSSGGGAGGTAGQQQDITLPRKVRVPLHGRPVLPILPTSTVHRLFGLDVQLPCPPSSSSSSSSGGGGGSRVGGPEAGYGGGAPSSPAMPGVHAQQQQQQQGGGAAGQGGMAGSGGSSSSASLANSQEVIQFCKFFHLVPTQGLRAAYTAAAAASSSSSSPPPSSPSSTPRPGSVTCWERLLAALDSSACGSSSSSSGGAGPGPAPAAGGGRQAARSSSGGVAGANLQPSTALLRRPAVVTLALVWESPLVPPDALKATLQALGAALELPAVFNTLTPTTPTPHPHSSSSSSRPGGASGPGHPAAPMWPPAPGSTYLLRAVVCYFGHHYLAFVLSEELGLWVMFDDADLQLVGGWPDVCRAMLARRMQPSLLMYEDCMATGGAPGPGVSVAVEVGGGRRQGR
ncbi:hypothetical protein V8C86DRAFT_1222292 [Haematococcus lacustris]